MDLPSAEHCTLYTSQKLYWKKLVVVLHLYDCKNVLLKILIFHSKFISGLKNSEADKEKCCCQIKAKIQPILC